MAHLAIFGFGRIGQAVAKRAQAFGMKILAVDPYLPKEVAQAAGVSLVEKEGYDVIFADPCMERMIPGFEGVFIPLTHFAVSGKLNV